MLSILNLSPVLSFLLNMGQWQAVLIEHGPRALNILSMSPVLKHFWGLGLCSGAPN